jgi:hypothetical protein
MNTTLNILNIKFLYDNILTKNIELRSIPGNRLGVMNYPAASRRGITKELVLLFAASNGGLTPK